MAMHKRITWGGVIGLLLLASILPGILWQERARTPDSSRYLSLGESLWQTGRFADFRGAPEALTPPLYPLVTGLSTHLGFGALLLLQALLFAATLLLWRRTLRCAQLAPATANGAMLVLALSPVPLLYVGRILSETLALFLLVAGAYLLCRLRRDAGLLFGAAILTRAILWPALLLGALAGLFFRRARSTLCWFLAGLLLVTGVWMIRNQIVFGSFRLVPLTGTTAEIALLAAPADDFARTLMELRGPTELANPFEEGDARARAALTLMRAHPARFGRNLAVTWLALWAPPIPDLLQSCGRWPTPAGLLAKLRSDGPRAALVEFGRRIGGGWPLVVPVAAWDLLISLCAGIGLLIWLFPFPGTWAARVRGHWPQVDRRTLIPIGLTLLVLLVAPMGVYHPRFRVPFAPVLALLAYPVLSATWMSAKRTGRRAKRER